MMALVMAVLIMIFLLCTIIGDPFHKLKRLFNEIDDDGSHRLRLGSIIHLVVALIVFCLPIIETFY